VSYKILLGLILGSMDNMGKMKKKASSLRNKNVVTSNVITQSAQGLNLVEKRILFSAIAQMGGKSDQGFIRLSVIDYAEVFGIATNTAYEQVKKASGSIFNKYITLREGDDAKSLVRHFRWLDAYEYKDSEGYVAISFSKHVIPYLVDLEKQFTKYRLKQACALRSVYSWRLLELFEQHSSGWLLISLDNLHSALEIPASQKANFGKFRSQTLDPAIKELSEKDNWVILYEPQKKGRKVDSIKFEFEKNKQSFLDFS